MSVSLEVMLTIVGAVITVIGVIFSFGFKFAKYDTMIKKNANDIDNIGSKLREDERQIQGLSRDVMQLSAEILNKFAEEVRPIRDSIAALTEKTIYNQTDIDHFKKDVVDIKTMITDIRKEIVSRPCVSHIKSEIKN